MSQRRIQLAILVLVFASLRGEAADRALEKIEFFPPTIELTSSRDRQGYVVQATYSDGITRDVTGEVKLSLSNDKLTKQEKGRFLPAADGEGKIRVEFGGKTLEASLSVNDAAKDRPIRFKLDVMPVFAKAGCNSGSCHGAARGKDGFRLSLFGFDPDGDFYRLTRELNGRRINLALVHDSLLLEKAGGRVPHTGGKRFDSDSELYLTLQRWLEAGAPADPKDIAKPLGIEIYPKKAVLNGEGTTQQMIVRASYSDGSTRDVTSLAHFMSNNETSATISDAGAVTAAARGEAFIMARFSTFTVGSHFIVLPKDFNFEFPKTPENNYVDRLVNEKLKKLRVAPSELCTDEEFLRRAYVDIGGVLPTVEEFKRFTESDDPKRRDKLVDELLGRKEFVELWVMKWAELLQIRSSRQVSYKAMLRYYNWLQERIANNVPMDRMARELLAATGGTFENAATNYYQNETNTLKVAENVAQVFMGMRIQCAQCHNHPFDRWTQNDYYSFAAFFSQVGRKRGEDPRETIVFDRGGGEVKHPVGGRVMPPKFLGGAVPDVKGKDRRKVLATWLASPENPFFAENLANIVWAHFFGMGIIHEVDDVRVSNPPSNAELLKELGRRFTEYEYDFRKLVRDICTSRSYQLATRTNASNKSDSKNFSHAAIRRIRAEILLDCVSQVTDTQDKFRGLPKGARAVQIADGSTNTYFLKTFGRASRQTVCSCEVKMEPTLSQALHLMNGDTVRRKIRQGGLINRRLKEERSRDEIVDELYIRSLSRKPTEKERAKFKAFFTKDAKPREVLEDIFWALLNSREFLFNH